MAMGYAESRREAVRERGLRGQFKYKERAMRCAAMTMLVVAMVAGTAAAEAVKFERRYEPGSKYQATRTMHVEQSLVLAGMNIDTSMEQDLVATSEVGERNADGSIEVTDTITAIRSVMDLPNGIQLEYDSENPVAESPDSSLDFITEMLDATVGVSWTKVVGEDGEVKEVKVAENDRLDNLSPLAAEMMRGQFEPERMLKAENQERKMLPSNAVEVGEFWDAQLELPLGSGQSLKVDYRFEYAGPVEEGGKTLHKIKSTATSAELVMDGSSQSPATIEESDLEVESSDGFSLFDAERGMTVRAEGSFRVVGDLMMAINGQALDAEVDLTIGTEVEVE